MRNIVTLILAGAALVYAVLAYQRVEELSEVVYRREAQSSQEQIQRNRVLTLGQQLEKFMRTLSGSGQKPAPASK